MDNERFHSLFNRYMDQSSSSDEEKELMLFLTDPANETTVKDLVENYWSNWPEKYDLTEEKWDSLYNEIQEVVKVPVKQIDSYSQQPARGSSWRRIAVAASIILAIGIGSYFFFLHTSSKTKEIVQAPLSKDVEAPKTTKATITLSDGRRVSVDSITQLTQNNVALTKTTDGNLVYSGKASEVAYNTVNNPRGSKVIDMTLADGTHFWLNAGSSITYPLSFTGAERKVSITGEAYFEVAHDANKPFIVNKGATTIQVLGTHFNVNAYDDEDAIRVTLLEGSVRITQNAESKMLKPGQQAQVTNNIKVVDDADLEQVMAWKNGRFKFNRTDLKIIMREIGRWYDVDVRYEGNIPVYLYNVGVPRTANVSEVLNGLEYTGAHFDIEGRTITVRP